MSCEEYRKALPLLSGPDYEQDPATDAVRAHLAVCSECSEQAEAYEADERALAACRAAQEAEPAALKGFADDVMARVLEAPKSQEGAGGAEILRPRFGFQAALAVAAVALLALTLGLLVQSSPSATEATTANEDVVRPIDSPIPVQPVRDEVVDLPAPRRIDRPEDRRIRAPMPRRLRFRDRGTFVPAESQPRRPSLNDLGDLNEIFNMLAPQGAKQRNWRMRRVPPLRKGEREVRF